MKDSHYLASAVPGAVLGYVVSGKPMWVIGGGLGSALALHKARLHEFALLGLGVGYAGSVMMGASTPTSLVVGVVAAYAATKLKPGPATHYNSLSENSIREWDHYRWGADGGFAVGVNRDATQTHLTTNASYQPGMSMPGPRTFTPPSRSHVENYRSTAIPY